MSKIETHQIRAHLITLSDKEAEFLRDYLQNWPYVTDEPNDLKEIRFELFEILNKATR